MFHDILLTFEDIIGWDGPEISALVDILAAGDIPC